MKLETFKREILKFSSIWPKWSFVQYNADDYEAIGIKAFFDVKFGSFQNNKETNDEDCDDEDLIPSDEDNAVAVRFPFLFSHFLLKLLTINSNFD